MSRLNICLLGPPRVERDGVLIEVDTRKAIALLAYLAVTGAAHGRDSLAAVLWPEADDARARGALRRTLSTLRGALDDEWLVVSREAIELRRDETVWIDVIEFRARLDRLRRGAGAGEPGTGAWRESLTGAIGLYRDDFMAGFSLRDSAPFDDWQTRQAEDLRREFSGALEALIASLMEAGDLQDAIAFSRRWLALDLLNEEAHRRLMLLFAWTGERAMASRQYRECVQILDQELGVAPLDETISLHQRILEGNILPRPANVDALAGDVAARNGAASVRLQHPYPLVGREIELRELATAYMESEHDGRLVLIEGEAGVGKTYLAETFLNQVRRNGAQVIAMRAFEGESHLVYGPFVEVVRGLIDSPDFATITSRFHPHVLTEVSRLVPYASPGADEPVTPAPLDSPGAQARFFDAVSQLMLAATAGTRPGILFVDDVQWLDRASLDLLGYFLRRLKGRSLLVVLGWRPDEATGADSIEHLFAESERAGIAERISIGRLGQADVRMLIDAVMDSEPDAAHGDLVERLYRETEGLPLFLAEYLTALQSRDDGAAGDVEWPVPRTVRDLILARLNALTESERRLLTTAAVVGRAFDVDTLRDINGQSEDEMVAGLESLIARGLIVETASRTPQGGQPADFDFSHEKVRAIVYEETSLVRRRLLHARVADAIRDHRDASPGQYATNLAYHLLRAGRDTEAAEPFKLAGDHARSLYANAEALAHYQSALSLGHPDPATLHEAIGDLQTLSGRYDEAIASYQAAESYADGPQVSIEHKLGNVYLRLGKWSLAERHFANADRLLSTPSEEFSALDAASLMTDWSLAAHRRGLQERGWSLGSRALELAELAGDGRVLARAHNLLGVLARGRGDLPTARHHFEQSLDIARHLTDLGARAAALNNLGLVASDEGDVDRAIALATEALELCITEGDRHREAAIYSNLADFLQSVGRHDDAMDYVRRSVEIYAEINVVAGEMQAEVWKLVEW